MFPRCNAGNASRDYKKRVHVSLAQARDHVMAGRMKEATSCFAHAYQLRCLCDWVWVNVLGNRGDFNHARFLQASRDFAKYTAGHSCQQWRRSRS